VGADLAAPSIYWSWQLHMLERTFRDKLGEELYEEFLKTGARAALYDMVRTPEHPWFVELGDPNHGGRDELASLALEDAVEELSAKLGPDPVGWSWGKLHIVTFEHPLGAVLPQVFNIGPFPSDGGPFTVLQARFDARKPYRQTAHPSMRMVVDLADLDATGVILPTGQSGQPFAPHWSDMTAKYLAGELVRLGFAKRSLGQVEGTLVFRPR
jgi:penicillin amidase